MGDDRAAEFDGTEEFQLERVAPDLTVDIVKNTAPGGTSSVDQNIDAVEKRYGCFYFIRLFFDITPSYGQRPYFFWA